MLLADWDAAEGWSSPRIVPFGPLHLLPSTSVFHYGSSCFEGLKAYRDYQGHIRLFRPGENMRRLNASAERLCLPTFDGHELLECIKELLRVDSGWIPDGVGYSLYIRPVLFATQDSLGVQASRRASLAVMLSPVGPYYSAEGFAAVSLKTEDRRVRAWPGGMGAYKFSGNYAPTIQGQVQAAAQGYDQLLWLFDDHVTEMGTMNAFVFLRQAKTGAPLLVTPPLDDLILPGVTRDSVLVLARQWGEFEVQERPVRMQEMLDALGERRLLEFFGTGTAAIVAPVKQLWYKGETHPIPLDPSDSGQGAGPLARRIWAELTGIQYGHRPHPWSQIV